MGASSDEAPHEEAHEGQVGPMCIRSGKQEAHGDIDVGKMDAEGGKGLRRCDLPRTCGIGREDLQLFLRSATAGVEDLLGGQGGHLRPQNAVTYDHRHLGFWVTYDHKVHGVTCDHRMRSLTTAKHFHNRTTETCLGDTPKDGLVYRLWACTHAGPFWWVGVG